MDKVLIVLVDALRWDYLNDQDTPFLYSLTKEGLYVKKLIPGYGFCERSEILTGGNALVTGNFAAYTYAPSKSPFQHLKNFQFLTASIDYCADGIPSLLPMKLAVFYDKVYRYLRSKLQRKYRKYFPSYSWNRIPFRFFHLFALTEDECKHTEPNAFPIPSIYDLLRDKGLSWYHGFHDLATDMQDSYEIELQNIFEAFHEPLSFYSFALGHLDTRCHKYGTSYNARIKTLNLVDNISKNIYEEFTRANPDGHIIFFGDHGMLDVHHVFNAEEKLMRFLRAKRWKTPQDIVYFLDSTMVRIWGEKAEKCRELFSSGDWLKYGEIIDAEIGVKLGISDKFYNYGELIWWANPGVVVFPDFFRRISPPKGMHGYDVNLDDHKGLAILSGPKVKSEIKLEANLLDIAPTVENILGLESPEQVVGQSWL